MSRIGKKPVPIPANVQASIEGQTVKIKGPKGELSFRAADDIKVAKSAAGIEVALATETKSAREKWGMSRSMIDNMVKGVTNGYSKTLEISGVGFRAQLKGKELSLQLGYSHEVNYLLPAGVAVVVGGAKQDQITISGIDKQQVGQVAAEIRAWRKPEPYQGKGVKYRGEYILRKEGKTKK
jgi:large subunit ribosomal protein L6